MAHNPCSQFHQLFPHPSQQPRLLPLNSRRPPHKPPAPTTTAPTTIVTAKVKNSSLPKTFKIDLAAGTANGWQLTKDGWKLSGWQCISGDCQRMAFAAAKGIDNYLVVGDSYDDQVTFRVVSSMRVALTNNQVLLGGHIHNPTDCKTTYAGIHQGPNADVVKAWKIDNKDFVLQSTQGLVVMDKCGA